MEDRYLYKAKGQTSGVWHEGLLVRMDKDVCCIKESPREEWICDPHTICMYTGLPDKNGKKIWENDILMANKNPNDIYRVCFGEFGVIDIETETITDRAIGWFLKVIPTEDVLSILEPFNADMPLNRIWIYNCELEVIGNIFDNPELMEGSSDE